MMQKIEDIKELEVILENVTSMVTVSTFTHLEELSLVKCRIERIEGLESLTFLKKLWLNENKISKLEGFDKCAQLEKLFLFANYIQKLEKLEGLKSLKVLDISQNKIEVIENISCLPILEYLNLAMNNIEKVGHRLKPLRSLKELNLSGNKINNVDEIKPLREMTHLKALFFFDPHYGENPICKIYNYQTFMLFTFDFLDKFDSLSINDESKKSAVVEFKRKRIYYNMKTKALKRLFNTLVKILRAVKDQKRDQIISELRLIGQCRAMLGSKFETIVKQAQKDWVLKANEEARITKVYEQFKDFILNQLKTHIDFINIELESTGNFK